MSLYSLKETEFYGSEVVKDFEEFKSRSNVIVANRNDETLADVIDKVYTKYYNNI